MEEFEREEKEQGKKEIIKSKERARERQREREREGGGGEEKETASPIMASEQAAIIKLWPSVCFSPKKKL